MSDYKIIRVGFKRLNDGATIPTKAHPSDSGYDLYAAEDVIIEPGETKIIPTGIAVKLPPGYEAQVRPRSGVTSRTKLRVQLGTIDQDYRGEIGVIVDNINEYESTATYAYKINGNDTELGEYVDYPSYLICAGDRIAQLVIQPLPAVEAYEIEGVLDDTERGEKGFGSSDDDSWNNLEHHECRACSEITTITRAEAEEGHYAIEYGLCYNCMRLSNKI